MSQTKNTFMTTLQQQLLKARWKECENWNASHELPYFDCKICQGLGTQPQVFENEKCNVCNATGFLDDVGDDSEPCVCKSGYNHKLGDVIEINVCEVCGKESNCEYVNPEIRVIKCCGEHLNMMFNSFVR